MSHLRMIILACGCCLIASTVSAGVTFYVDDDAPPDGSGVSWGSAYNDLQDAFEVVITGGEIVNDQINNSPHAEIVATPTCGRTPLTVQFSGAQSHDDETPTDELIFEWDFGDGETAGDGSPGEPFINVEHFYPEDGEYVAMLTVTDEGGQQDFATVEIVVGNTLPVPVIFYNALEGFGPEFEVVFNAIQSYDAEDTPEGIPLTIAWIWGDDTPNETWPSTGANGATDGSVPHTYVLPDGWPLVEYHTYAIVTDSDGCSTVWGGVWVTVYEPIGGCCFDDGTCLDLLEAECLDEGGTPMGEGTECVSFDCHQACCWGASLCLDLSVDDCLLADGINLGWCTACSITPCPFGACCLLDGSCLDDLLEDDCLAQGGFYQGDGVECWEVICPDPIGACCLSNGECLELSPDNCDVIPDSWWAGVLTTCEDSDSNGTADDCETVVYVDVNADQEPHDGSDWCHAYLELYEALDVVSVDTTIRVADGTYLPDTSGLTDPRAATFRLINGVTVEGGYAGCGAPDPDERDVELYQTILSGDIGTPDYSSDNCYHVFYHPYGLSLDSTAVLDGFTITAGNADGTDPHDCGGGMYNSLSNPTVTNCTFSENRADYSGGGVNNDWSSPTVTNCTFSENSAESGCGGGMYNENSSPTVANCTFSGNTAEVLGGGMCNWTNNSPTVTNCTFSGNEATWDGGGMSNWGSNPTVTNCTFSENRADTNGGGMYNICSSSPTLANCTFSGNSADSGCGGGMFNDSSSPALTNCTFSENSAGLWGGGMYNSLSSPTLTNCTITGNTATDDGGGVCCRISSAPALTNCILWADIPQEIYVSSGTPVVTYCDIEGGWEGEGNIDDDPLFVDPGYWDDNGTPGDPYDDFWVDGDYHLQAGSPCIDTGSNEAPGLPDTDLDGHARILCELVDMGAYEFGMGDYECDQDVDLFDFANWDACMTGPDNGPYPNGCEAFDFDGDEDVDLSDFAGFQAVFTGP